MPLPDIPHTFQATLVWTSSSAPRPATNTMYFTDLLGTQDAVDLADDIDASVTQTMWDIVGGTSTKVAQVETKELLNPEPAPYIKVVSGTKWQAGSSADPILQGACVVSLKTLLAGKHYRGRIYLPWVNEGGQTAGVLSSANVSTMQAAWAAFLLTMFGKDWQMAVVSPSLAVATDVSQAIVRPNLLTQRRRARR